MRHLIISLLCITSFSLAGAQTVISLADAQANFSKKTHIIGTDTLRYRELTPESLIPGKKYPLVVFLHGSGERGTDNVQQLKWGGNMWLNPTNRDRYPAYVIFPQCPADKYWDYPTEPADSLPTSLPVIADETPLMSHIMTLLQGYIASGKADPKRIYVIGMSMGGMATYDIVLRHPRFFAAAIPICGEINPARFTNGGGGTKWRIFHGDTDDNVPVQGSRMAYRQLTRLGASVSYTEFPSCGHFSWVPVFQLPDFMSWLFAQHL